MQRLIQINSKNRVNPDSTTSSDFTVNLGHDSLQSVKAIYVKEVQFANTAYNINASNRFWYVVSGGLEYTVDVAPGQYTLAEFLVELIDSFTNVNGAVLTATLLSPGGKLFFTSDIACSFSKYRLDGTTLNPMAQVLGITNASLAEVLNHTAGAVPNLSGLRSLYICSNALSGGSCITSRGQKISLLDSVPVDVAYGDIKHHSSEGYTDSHAYTDELYNNLTSIDIKLLDEDGNTVDLNGSNINIILMAVV